ncbi:MAG: permease prefix domain 1-containing protein [Lachnospiraceae bacterium]
MDTSEYMDILLEQIHEKKVRPFIREEIESHLTDCVEECRNEGMNEHQAMETAVSRMGDPQETGRKLDKIHRARFPYDMLAIALLITLAGIVMQAIIFPQIDNTLVQTTYLTRTIVYNLLGFAVIILLLRFDYTMLAHNSMLVYALYLAIAVSGTFLIAGNYARAWVFSYYCDILYPLVFCAMAYRFSKKGTKGILILGGISVFTLLLFAATGISAYSSTGVFEAFICCLIILTVMVMKGMFQGNRKLQLAMILGPGVGIPAFMLCDILTGGRVIHLAAYQMARIKALLHPYAYPDSYGYMITRIRQSTTAFTVKGNGMLPEISGNELFSDLMINSIFSYFGIFAGTCVMLLLALFLIRGFQVSVNQKNRIGFLFGITCCSSLAVRIISYFLYNFGLSVMATTSMPFLTYGLGNSLLNGIYIGLLLSVYRNTDILMEKGNGIRFPYRLQIRIEKN